MRSSAASSASRRPPWVLPSHGKRRPAARASRFIGCHSPPAHRIVPNGDSLRLRSHLVVLVLAAVIPLVVFALIIVRQDLAERRQILERGMHDTASALSLAVDSEVKTSLAVLETLAGAVVLDRGDLRAFHEICVRAMQAR